MEKNWEYTMIIDFHYHFSQTKDDEYSLDIDKNFIKESCASFVDKICLFPYFVKTSYFINKANNFILENPENYILPSVRVRVPFSLKKDLQVTLRALKSYKISFLKKFFKSLIVVKHKKQVILHKNINDIPTLESIPKNRYFLIKFHDYQDGTLTEEIFYKLLKFKKPMLFHISPYKLAYFLEKMHNINVPIIIAHLGKSGLGLNEESLAITLAKQYDFIFLDTGGITDITLLKKVLDNVPYKLVFGSDGPVFSPRAIELTLLDACKILKKNFDSILKIFERNSHEILRFSNYLL